MTWDFPVCFEETFETWSLRNWPALIDLHILYVYIHRDSSAIYSDQTAEVTPKGSVLEGKSLIHENPGW